MSSLNSPNPPESDLGKMSLPELWDMVTYVQDEIKLREMQQAGTEEERQKGGDGQ